jgi:nucleotide-binding universal stress UspA family protein
MARTTASGEDGRMTQSHLPRLAVVGHDGRHGGDIALDAALGLRERFGTTVIVVHGLDLPAPRDIAGRPDEIELMRTGACDRAERALSERLDTKLGTNADGVELAIFPGSPVAAIAEVARDRKADVLVLGPHRKDGPLDFGRTTRALLAATRCDVWMQPSAVQPLERVIVPFDGSDESTRGLKLGLELARNHGVPLIALQAYAPPEFAYPSPDGSDVLMPMYVVEQQRSAMKERFEASFQAIDKRGVAVTTRFVDGDPAVCIEEEQRSADLVVMGTHGRTGIAAALLGGVAAAVLKRAKGPVFAVRAQGRFGA